MMKHVLYIVFMLLANVGIVSHAVVSHPHQRCDAAVHHHHADEPGECLIDGSYTAPRIQNEEYSLVPVDAEHKLNTFSPFDVAEFLYAIRFYPWLQKVRYKPYVADTFPDYVAVSLGLRAPPCVF